MTSPGIRRSHNRGITRGNIFIREPPPLSLSLSLFSKTYSVLCSTLESRNPTWAVSAAGSFSSRSASDSPHPLGAKRPSIYSLILDEGAVSFLLSGYPFRTVPRKEGPPRTSSTPRRSRSSFSFPPGLLSFFFFYSLSFSPTLLPSPALASQRIQTRTRAEKEGGKGREGKTERERRSRDGRSREKSRRRRRSRRSGEDKVSFYSSPGTRSVPFHGAYAYTYVYFCMQHIRDLCGETDTR